MFFHKESLFSKFNIVLFILLFLTAVFNFVFLTILFLKFYTKMQVAQPAKIKITIIEAKECKNCFDTGEVVSIIKEMGVKITKEKRLAQGDKIAQKLIEKYKIERLPVFLAEGELEKNPALKPFWDFAGRIENGVFVLTRVLPPYLELKNGQIRGNFIAVYLTDASCKECYDVKIHQNALLNLGMKEAEEKIIDIVSEEGKKLIKDYKIRYAPTLILKGDLEVYENFQQIWPQVGTVEKDGAYIFREDGLKQMGAYKDIKSGKVIRE